MRRERRLQEKRKRREKRDVKHAHSRAESADRTLLSDLHRLLRSNALFESMTAPVPGACHPAVQQPGLVKADYGDWLNNHPRWSTCLRDLERRYSQGLLHAFPDIDHWAMEELFWHGVPGASTHPLDDWLDSSHCRLTPEAREQLRQWKCARVGIFEIGDARGDTVRLRPCDERACRTGDPEISAICLSIEGARGYRDKLGQLAFGYLAPWKREEQLWSLMGYGLTVPASSAGLLRILANLAHPDVVATPLPWLEHRGTHRKLLAEWKKRDWYAEFEQRTQLPFDGVAMLPNEAVPIRVTRLHPSPDIVRSVGIYFESEAIARPDAPRFLTAHAKPALHVVGASSLQVLDLRSSNAQLFAEYAAYRQAVGVPPGLVGAPAVFRS